MKIEARPYKKPYINFFAALVAVGVVVFIFTNLAIIPSSFNWQKSDILFSARFTQTATIDAAKFEKGKTYGATNLVWHYAHPQTQNAETIATSFLLADFNRHIGQRNQCAIEVYAKQMDEVCLDLYGKSVLGSWEKSFKVLGRGDTNKQQYIERQWGRMKFDLAQGCRHFQQDSADQNWGTLRYGGCFSPEGDAKFRQYLKKRLNTEQLKLMDVVNVETFSYSDFLRSKGLPGELQFYTSWKKTNHPLVDYYEDFNRLTSEAYLRELRTRAEKEIGQPVGIYGNLFRSRESTWIYRALDGPMTELSEAHATLGNLVQEVAITAALGRQNHVFTLTSGNVGVNRRVLATTYATGSHMIMPTDVYTGVDTPRVDIAATEISDILDLVKKQKRLLNGYQRVESSGVEVTNSVTKISVDSSAGRVLVYHARSSEMPNIQRDAIVQIGAKKFNVVADTGIGVIYLPLGSEKQIAVGMNVNVIENPDGTGYDFTGQIASAGPTIRKIEFGSQAGTVLLYTSLGGVLGAVARGARFRVGDNQFEVISDSTIGILAIAQDKLVLDLVGSEITQLDNNAGFSFDYTGDRSRAPRVLSAEEGPGYTVVKLSGGIGSVIPRGTKLSFFNGELSTVADTTVGLAYVHLEQLTNIIPGSLISAVEFPDGRKLNFRADPAVPFAKADLGGWLMSVSRAGKDRKKSVIHLVDRLEAPRTIKFSLRLVDVFGAVPKKLYLHEGQRAIRELAITSQGGGWYQVINPGIRTWGILEPVW